VLLDSAIPPRQAVVGTDDKDFLDIEKSIQIVDFKMVKGIVRVIALKLEALDERRRRVEVAKPACPDGDDVHVPVDPDIAAVGTDLGKGPLVKR